ncbi:MAG: hypothetical protein GY854_09445 [Deltaproteobacteria bacterium]|nr:hypothetical protein [Deltaproteobacteria bacterium]
MRHVTPVFAVVELKKRISIILGLFVWTVFTANAFAVVPPLIPVQGVLTDADGQALDGSHDLSFTIYESLTATSSLWTETQTGVTVDQGFFSVYLGDETTLPIDVLVSADELWLSMTVGTEELSRVQLASVPYALEAQVCQRVGNLTENDITTGFSAVGHDHDDLYYTETESNALLAGKADAGHDHDKDYAPLIHAHDDLYYTETEADILLAGKADAGHDHDEDYAPLIHAHDDLYYTETESNALLAGKADTSHDHAETHTGTEILRKVLPLAMVGSSMVEIPDSSSAPAWTPLTHMVYTANASELPVLPGAIRRNKIVLRSSTSFAPGCGAVVSYRLYDTWNLVQIGSTFAGANYCGFAYEGGWDTLTIPDGPIPVNWQLQGQSFNASTQVFNATVEVYDVMQ